MVLRLRTSISPELYEVVKFHFNGLFSSSSIIIFLESFKVHISHANTIFMFWIIHIMLLHKSIQFRSAHSRKAKLIMKMERQQKKAFEAKLNKKF